MRLLNGKLTDPQSGAHYVASHEPEANVAARLAPLATRWTYTPTGSDDAVHLDFSAYAPAHANTGAADLQRPASDKPSAASLAHDPRASIEEQRVALWRDRADLLQQEIDRERTKHRDEIERIRDDHAARTATLRDEIEDLGDELTRLKREHADALHALKEKHRDEVLDLKEQLRAASTGSMAERFIAIGERVVASETGQRLLSTLAGAPPPQLVPAARSAPAHAAATPRPAPSSVAHAMPVSGDGHTKPAQPAMAPRTSDAAQSMGDALTYPLSPSGEAIYAIIAALVIAGETGEAAVTAAFEAIKQHMPCDDWGSVLVNISALAIAENRGADAVATALTALVGGLGPVHMAALKHAPPQALLGQVVGARQVTQAQADYMGAVLAELRALLP